MGTQRQRTVLVISCEEVDGMFDHVVPPSNAFALMAKPVRLSILTQVAARKPANPHAMG